MELVGLENDGLMIILTSDERNLLFLAIGPTYIKMGSPIGNRELRDDFPPTITSFQTIKMANAMELNLCSSNHFGNTTKIINLTEEEVEGGDSQA